VNGLASFMKRRGDSVKADAIQAKQHADQKKIDIAAQQTNGEKNVVI